MGEMKKLRKLTFNAHDIFIIVDTSIQPVNGYYYDTFIGKIKNTGGAQYAESDLTEQITHSTHCLNCGYFDVIQSSKGGLLVCPCCEFTWKYEDLKYMNIAGIRELIGDVFSADKLQKKYTEKDLENAIIMAREGGVSYNPASTFHENSFDYTIKEIIESLEPKIVWDVETINGILKIL